MQLLHGRSISGVNRKCVCCLPFPERRRYRVFFGRDARHNSGCATWGICVCLTCSPRARHAARSLG